MYVCMYLHSWVIHTRRGDYQITALLKIRDASFVVRLIINILC